MASNSEGPQPLTVFNLSRITCPNNASPLDETETASNYSGTEASHCSAPSTALTIPSSLGQPEQVQEPVLMHHDEVSRHQVLHDLEETMNIWHNAINRFASQHASHPSTVDDIEPQASYHVATPTSEEVRAPTPVSKLCSAITGPIQRMWNMGQQFEEKLMRKLTQYAKSEDQKEVEPYLHALEATLLQGTADEWDRDAVRGMFDPLHDISSWVRSEWTVEQQDDFDFMASQLRNFAATFNMEPTYRTHPPIAKTKHALFSSLRYLEALPAKEERDNSTASLGYIAQRCLGRVPSGLKEWQRRIQETRKTAKAAKTRSDLYDVLGPAVSVGAALGLASSLLIPKISQRYRDTDFMTG